MLIISDADSVRPSERFDFWREVVCQHFVPATSHSESREAFQGRLTSCELGQFGAGLLEATPHLWTRDARQIRVDGRDDFLLGMVVSGEGRLTQDDRTVHQMPGQLILYDARRPFDYRITDKTIVFRVRRSTLLSHAKMGEALCVTHLGEGSPLRDILGATLQHCVNVPDHPPPGHAVAAHLGASIFNMLLALLELKTGEMPISMSSCQVVQLERVKRQIMANLGDPSLSCEKLAQQAGTSVRTLNRLFGTLGTTPMRWVWQQRLEATRRDLVEGRAKTVTEAALRSGFSELSHFSRSFKSRYGVTPRSLLREPAD